MRLDLMQLLVAGVAQLFFALGSGPAGALNSFFNFGSDPRDFLLAAGLVYIRHDVLREVEHLLQRSWRYVEQKSDAARRAAHEPNVRHGRGQDDVSHALTADLRPR